MAKNEVGAHMGHCSTVRKWNSRKTSLARARARNSAGGEES